MAVIPDDGDPAPNDDTPRYKPALPEIPPDPWQGLSTSSTLEFQTDAALMCIKACTTALERVLGIQQKIKDTANADQYSRRYSHLPSGEQLATLFNTKKLGNLSALLDIHSTILGEMRDTFEAAGKRYAGVEADSAGDFRLLSEPKPGNFANDPPAPGTHKPSGSYSDNIPIPTSMTNWTGKYDAETISAENPYMMDYATFYQLGQGIKPELAADAAALWSWMANELGGAFKEFTGRLLAAGDNWRGDGWDKAQSASKAYADNVQGLTTGMQMIADNLDYVSHFLTATKDQMPTSPQPTDVDTSTGTTIVTDSGSSDDLQTYAKVVENHYAHGVAMSSFQVPILIAPANPVAAPLPVAPPPPPAEPPPVAAAHSPSRLAGGGSTPNLAAAAAPLAGSTDATSAALPVTQPDLSQATQQSVPQDSQPASVGDQTAQQAMQGAQGLSQALQGAQSLAQQAASAGQAAAMQNALGGAKMAELTSRALGGIGGGAKGAGGLGAGALGKEAPLVKEPVQSRLFPRASLPGNAVGAATGIGRAGMAPPMGAPGAGTPGAAGGQGQQRREHKRPEYLESAEHLDEAMGNGLKATKPVLDS